MMDTVCTKTEHQIVAGTSSEGAYVALQGESTRDRYVPRAPAWPRVAARIACSPLLLAGGALSCLATASAKLPLLQTVRNYHGNESALVAGTNAKRFAELTSKLMSTAYCAGYPSTVAGAQYGAIHWSEVKSRQFVALVSHVNGTLGECVTGLVNNVTRRWEAHDGLTLGLSMGLGIPLTLMAFVGLTAYFCGPTPQPTAHRSMRTRGH